MSPIAKTSSASFLLLIPEGSPLRKELALLYKTNRQAYLNLKAVLEKENRRNSDSYLESFANSVQNSRLYDFLFYGFLWDDTPQGHEYWSDVAASLL